MVSQFWKTAWHFFKNQIKGTSVLPRWLNGKNIYLPIQETWGQALGWEDPLEKEIATHSSILVWEIPWIEEPGRLESTESQKIWTGLSD